jgi:hypothetical protein
MIPMLNVFKIQQHFNTPPQMAQQQYVYLMSKNFDFEIQFVKITCIHPVCIYACVRARARVRVCVFFITVLKSRWDDCSIWTEKQ